MKPTYHRSTRRQFLRRTAAAATITLVPRRVLGGPGAVPPSEEILFANLGLGGVGIGFHLADPKAARYVARCDVSLERLGVKEADNKTHYTDFRRVLDRRDIDAVRIGTPPHWHALMAVAALQAGKHVICEKPMTRYIAEGRAMVNAVKRYNRVFRVNTFRRMQAMRGEGASGKRNVEIHKIMTRLRNHLRVMPVLVGEGRMGRYFQGLVNQAAEPVPPGLDYDLWLGPAPYKPFTAHRVGWPRGGTWRGYWDYESGILTDLGSHSWAATSWVYGLEGDHPVEVRTPDNNPPQHPDAVGVEFHWVELKYADGVTVYFRGYAGEKYPGSGRDASAADLDDEGRRKLAQIPDPPPQPHFDEAVRTGRHDADCAEAHHRVSTLLHLVEIAARTGRSFRFDPHKEEIVGDEEANFFVNPPMRSPWRLPQV
jgi:predicted dehydrogenase